MRKLLESSLATRLAVILCTTSALLFCLSEVTSFFISYQNIRHHITSDLIHWIDLRAAFQNYRNLSTQQNAKNLLDKWKRYHSNPYITPSVTDSIGSRQVLSLNPINPDPTFVLEAQHALKTFEVVSNSDYVDSFILLPGKGIALLPLKESLSPQDIETRRNELLALSNMPIIEGICWGKPYFNASLGWRVSVAAVDPETGAMAGLGIGISDPSQSILRASSGTLVFFKNDQGEIFPSPTIPLPDPILNRIRQFPSCKRSLISEKLDDYHLFCKPLTSPNHWQMITLYPSREIVYESLLPLWYRLPLAAISLILLIGMLYLTLRRYLSTPLHEFVKLIEQLGPTSINQFLPEERQDELGRIARAYNGLLRAIESHYNTLERKVVERTRKLNEARRLAEQANRNKSELITNISHEIRTPLNGIVGALELLRHKTNNPEQQNLVDMAFKSSGFLLEIINNLLDFSRIEAKQMALSIEETSLLSLIDQVMLTIQPNAQEKGLQLQTWVYPAVPLSLPLDALRVRQILLNLLGNGIKFTDKGYLKLIVRFIDSTLMLTVEDSGPGIPIEEQERIFQPFAQIEEHASGTGLGLAIANQLVFLMGGQITLESDVGNGARFTVALPMPKRKAASLPFHGEIAAPPALHGQLKLWGFSPTEQANQKLESPDLTFLPGKLWHCLSYAAPAQLVAQFHASPWSLKVLVVDDVATNRDIVGEMLKLLGHHVVTAPNGNEALLLGRTYIFDLVLMDVRMAGMDGLETTQQWRHGDQGILDPECPIIALTANTLPAERDRVRAVGMNDYLAKPVTLPQLASAIDFAIHFQLGRGIEMNPNTALQKPLLDNKYKATDIEHELQQLLKVLRKDFEENGDMSASLHALKGCAGQAGMHLIWDAASELEKKLNQGEAPDQSAIDTLEKLIRFSHSAPE